MASVPTEDVSYTRVNRELREALRPSGCSQPHETARMLLSYDTENNRLAGLCHWVDAVVYYFEAKNTAVKIAFDASGLDERGGLPLIHVDSPREFRRWVGKMAPYYWDWVHPRYAPQTPV